MLALDGLPADAACCNASWTPQDGSDTGSGTPAKFWGTPAMRLGSPWSGIAGCLGTWVTDDWRAAATEPADAFAGESSATTGAEATVPADAVAADALSAAAAAGEAAAAFAAFAGSNTDVTMPCKAAAAAAPPAVSAPQESLPAPVAFLQHASAAASAILPVHSTMGLVMMLLVSPWLELLSLLLSASAKVLQSLAKPMAGLEHSFV